MTTCQPIAALAAILACLIVSSCASARPETPVEVVDAFLRADADDKAQWLLDPELSGDQLPESAQGAKEVVRHATWHRPGHPDAALRAVEGRWEFTTGALRSWSATTPAQALALFARSVNSGDAALLIALMPEAEQAHWSLERAAHFLGAPEQRSALTALIEGLRVGPEAAAVSPGSLGKITLRGEAGQVVLVRETQGWKVEDLRPHARFLPAESDSPKGE